MRRPALELARPRGGEQPGGGGIGCNGTRRLVGPIAQIRSRRQFDLAEFECQPGAQQARWREHLRKSSTAETESVPAVVERRLVSNVPRLPVSAVPRMQRSAKSAAPRPGHDAAWR